MILGGHDHVRTARTCAGQSSTNAGYNTITSYQFITFTYLSKLKPLHPQTFLCLFGALKRALVRIRLKGDEPQQW